jgi:hypothetical protein
MRAIVKVSVVAAAALVCGAAFAYTTEKYGEESGSFVYKVTCSDGSSQLVRNEKSNGKWCSGYTCYDSLDALMRRMFINCN